MRNPGNLLAKDYSFTRFFTSLCDPTLLMGRAHRAVELWHGQHLHPIRSWLLAEENYPISTFSRPARAKSCNLTEPPCTSRRRRPPSRNVPANSTFASSPFCHPLRLLFLLYSYISFSPPPPQAPRGQYLRTTEPSIHQYCYLATRLLLAHQQWIWYCCVLLFPRMTRVH